ncbi:unnamed protein product [Miscanthus lutarioriparius]|uniref:Uncharacterized protein n=1 Tax=Miscanthus lutarioriparius TaxID=422564 RepID=A0A811QZJ3_9POAL|nr:unnamed protein product [Miscanthus lutarioriparius]
MDTVREEAWPVAAPQQRQQPSAPQPEQQQQQNGRIDLRELKAQMEKRLGPDRSRRYFGYLNGYLSERLGRQDFEKLCLQTLGRENLQLHNRLIRAILYNAYQGKCPPPPPPLDAGRRPVGASVKKASQAAEVLNACNGDARLLQVQGLRPVATAQDHTLKDSMNNMGPNCRVTTAVNHNQVTHGASGSLENGEDHFNSCLDHGGLFNTELLHRRMEKTAETLGLAGVTMDSAELLNIALDKYMKT